MLAICCIGLFWSIQKLKWLTWSPEFQQKVTSIWHVSVHPLLSSSLHFASETGSLETRGPPPKCSQLLSHKAGSVTQSKLAWTYSWKDQLRRTFWRWLKRKKTFLVIPRIGSWDDLQETAIIIWLQNPWFPPTFPINQPLCVQDSLTATVFLIVFFLLWLPCCVRGCDDLVALGKKEHFQIRMVVYMNSKIIQNHKS